MNTINTAGVASQGNLSESSASSASSARERTEFGRLLESFRKRAQISQRHFCELLVAMGYPVTEGRGFSQQLYSQNLSNASPRVHPCFFDMARTILELSDFEYWQLVHTWLSLSPSGAGAASGRQL